MTDPASPDSDATKTKVSTPAPEVVAPDVGLSLFDFLRTRRNVKFTLAYLAVGWALLEFLSIAVDTNWIHYRLIVELYLVVYVAGFVIALAGGYLFAVGRHPYRSIVLFLMVGVSVGAGFILAHVRDLRATGQLQEAGGSVPAPGTPRTLDTAPPQAPETVRAGIIGSGAPAPSSGVIGQATNDDRVEAPMAAQEPAAPATTPESSAARESSTTRAAPQPQRPASITTVAPEPATEVTVRRPAPAVPAPTTVDPVDAKLAELIQMFGSGEETTVDTSRPYEMLAAFDRPFAVRLTSFSSGVLVVIQDRTVVRGRFQRLELRNRGDRVTEQVTIVTGCGDFVYNLEATLLQTRTAARPAQGRLVLRLDRDAARQAVSRAIALGRCI